MPGLTGTISKVKQDDSTRISEPAGLDLVYKPLFPEKHYSKIIRVFGAFFKPVGRLENGDP